MSHDGHASFCENVKKCLILIGKCNNFSAKMAFNNISCKKDAHFYNPHLVNVCNLDSK